jgi:hypothetical protein
MPEGNAELLASFSGRKAVGRFGYLKSQEFNKQYVTGPVYLPIYCVRRIAS